MVVLAQCIAFPSVALASTGDNADLQRVEALSRKTRATEALILDEIMGRMGRIESTTADIRALIEAMPVGAIPSGAASSAPPPAQADRPGNNAVCPKPPPVVISNEQEDDTATQLPVSLVAGGSAVIALLIGLLIGRRRGSRPPTPVVPEASIATTASASEINRENIPLWQPKSAPDSGRTRASEATLAPLITPVPRETAPTMGTPARSDSASAMLKTGERTRTKANKPGEEQITVLPTDIGSTNSQEIFDPTLELAEIMLSMGLASGAAQALEEHIRENPREALVHWLKLLDVYRKDGHRTDFEKAARELRKNFNINASDWLDVGGKPATLENYERVMQQIISLWPQPGACIDYLRQLLEDNRDGMRNGFPQPVAEEIILLVAILKATHPELLDQATVETPAGGKATAGSKLL
ncbi:MAG: hypothetical protein IPH08_06615 [Rhodocyclaceae bacterium]|nr:hypothetical protein [Rhodocyclaceae bacterium]MBK6906753.1 hypothetical protein [Rhodocyclaceae bacterium]